ncbi:hypothetical protein AYI69_g9382 [Smittium culicis]|uniref:Uncharacterized protein n=1 Tax=Smittium culicis TaxID=133412 RepID=A0A1R1XD08_9FUNG|nr:hypothetical protein AYI69_g9382 [Smittium culicis]
MSKNAYHQNFLHNTESFFLSENIGADRPTTLGSFTANIIPKNSLEFISSSIWFLFWVPEKVYEPAKILRPDSGAYANIFISWISGRKHKPFHTENNPFHRNMFSNAESVILTLVVYFFMKGSRSLIMVDTLKSVFQGIWQHS